jgi:hypothetical protein
MCAAGNLDWGRATQLHCALHSSDGEKEGVIVPRRWRCVASEKEPGSRRGWKCAFMEGCTRPAFYLSAGEGGGGGRYGLTEESIKGEGLYWCRLHRPLVHVDNRRKALCSVFGCGRRASWVRLPWQPSLSPPSLSAPSSGGVGRNEEDGGALPKWRDEEGSGALPKEHLVSNARTGLRDKKGSRVLPKWCGIHARGACFYLAMVRRCRASGCTKIAHFGSIADGVACWCVTHKLSSDINVGARFCQVEECQSKASRVYTVHGQTMRLCRYCYKDVGQARWTASEKEEITRNSDSIGG